MDILTGTLGKAIGGASGGYVASRREVVELLRQRSRPYLFSNTVAPPIVGAALAALDLLESSGERRERLAANTAWFRERLGQIGLEVLPGEHPIVPVMLGDENLAVRFSEELRSEGVLAVGFTYPVVPRGRARIRTQISAAHSDADLEQAVARVRGGARTARTEPTRGACRYAGAAATDAGPRRGLRRESCRGDGSNTHSTASAT